MICQDEFAWLRPKVNKQSPEHIQNEKTASVIIKQFAFLSLFLTMAFNPSLVSLGETNHAITNTFPCRASYSPSKHGQNSLFISIELWSLESMSHVHGDHILSCLRLSHTLLHVHLPSLASLLLFLFTTTTPADRPLLPSATKY
ncbi:unnamed protein product [Sphenostylis stenocarpa]|uniref:Uncharacterized protein n=1 Tax=Sphenostylis stenocarpa TaxID=92480 RepID=A0AA86S4B5_9FABA|nr:unnamed protein product [Sphenostylis stenocarpa]